MIHALYAILWGATWGNNVAWLESLAVAGLATYALHRLGVLGHLADKAGRHLAAWWARHHGPHAIEQHKRALREMAAERGPGRDDPGDFEWGDDEWSGQP